MFGVCRHEDVAIRSKTSRSRKAREWCLDNGFELLCSEKKSCWVMDIDEAESGESNGATGMSRVVEALSANMWCSMIRGVPPVPDHEKDRKGFSPK